MFSTNKLKIFEIIWKNLAIIDSSKTSIISKKRVKYKLLQLLKATIVATINSNKKTSNNSTSNNAFIKLSIFIKYSKTKEIEEIKDCKYYFINIDFLKQISCKLRSKIEIYIENKYFFTIYLIIRLTSTKNFLNLYYIYTCKIAKYIKLKFNNIRHKIILKRLKIC